MSLLSSKVFCAIAASVSMGAAASAIFVVDCGHKSLNLREKLTFHYPCSYLLTRAVNYSSPLKSQHRTDCAESCVPPERRQCRQRQFSLRLAQKVVRVVIFQGLQISALWDLSRVLQRRCNLLSHSHKSGARTVFITHVSTLILLRGT